MTKRFDIVEHLGADMDSRFYVNGKRESAHYVRALKDRADSLECLSTFGRQMPGGRIRRTNYSVAVYN